ncbi:MAG: hypothetical protein KDI76_14265 [Xanthomonadales bacterium]|nr:hypothetical protein [Xanthomonadales bacterium]
MANLGKLSKSKKGTAPSMDQAPDNVSHPASDGNAPKEKIVPIQFKVTETEYNQFCRLAGDIVGFRKGDKSKMFSKMLESYANN